MNRRLEEFDLDEAEKVEDNNDNGEAIRRGMWQPNPSSPPKRRKPRPRRTKQGSNV